MRSLRACLVYARAFLAFVRAWYECACAYACICVCACAHLLRRIHPIFRSTIRACVRLHIGAACAEPGGKGSTRAGFTPPAHCPRPPPLPALPRTQPRSSPRRCCPPAWQATQATDSSRHGPRPPLEAGPQLVPLPRHRLRARRTRPPELVSTRFTFPASRSERSLVSLLSARARVR